MKDILEGNKLIAEFMEVKYGIKEHLTDNGDEYNFKFEKIYTPFIFSGDIPKSNNFSGYKYAKYFEKFEEEHNNLLLYHSSWNWLMPVIDKIENLDVSDQHYKWEAHDGERSNFIGFEFEMKRWCDGYSSCISMDLQLDPSETIAGDYYKHYPTRIEAVWNCVVEFIEYYNKIYSK